ncbi:unnamed protein product, partial [Chrysoparadoxa australica]
ADIVFPEDFIWGTATSSYQIEGGWQEGGKGWSIWDAFSHCQDGTPEGHTGDVACDHYHRFREDIKLMQASFLPGKSVGLKYYRFSIAWSRIQPTGTGPANKEGVAFYNALIDCLLEHEIEPLVTLYHWDLPLALQIEYQGWLGRDVVEAFAEYAYICFESFGDRVQQWITFNEPWCSSVLGYGNGEHAPGIKSADGSKVYLSSHHCLLAHARAVQLYRDVFQRTQGGRIGITLNANWTEPVPEGGIASGTDPKPEDAAAASRALIWSLGLFAHPIWLGDYPAEMKKKCGNRLPTFTTEELGLVKGSSDFFGLNHYSSEFVEHGATESFESLCKKANIGGYFGDMCTKPVQDETWIRTDMGWPVVPWGFKKLLLYIHKTYSPPGGIIVTENGCAVKEEDTQAAERDQFRVDYLRVYIEAMYEAIAAGADVRGYFAWSWMDNFEWALGYNKRFGLVRVDYETQV